MRLLDEEYTRHPFLSVIKLTDWLKNGFIYLMAIIDWFIRYILDYGFSITLEADSALKYWSVY